MGGEIMNRYISYSRVPAHSGKYFKLTSGYLEESCQTSSSRLYIYAGT